MKPLKDEVNKSAIEYIDPNMILELWDLLYKWAKKYAPMSWVDVKTESHYASAMRHLLKWRTWELIDEETKIHHLTAVIANAMFIMYNEKNKWKI